ncbi:cobalt-precorrin-7 (C5)-methyltransferase [Desulfitispora alkaliphila]|uniref:precorrin-6y C5,15-methyltransferase (decarboxylating) subunit CbiE n=1 Tax=Desulfitispora alkaliphila TaxID=622674 RepID=UPI003D19944E
MAKQITVIGVGPGDRKYLTQIAQEKIDKAEIIIAGKRHLQELCINNKNAHEIDSDLKRVVNHIDQNRDKRIAVLVSGDTGFYSLLKYLKNHYSSQELEVIPGISSVQLAFARITELWQDAIMTSLHGKSIDIIEKFIDEKKVALLTDKQNTPQEIAKVYVEQGLGMRKFFVCENLSYSSEVIVEKKAVEVAVDAAKYNNCVVVIIDDNS